MLTRNEEACGTLWESFAVDSGLDVSVSGTRCELRSWGATALLPASSIQRFLVSFVSGWMDLRVADEDFYISTKTVDSWKMIGMKGLIQATGDDSVRSRPKGFHARAETSSDKMNHPEEMNDGPVLTYFATS